MTILSFQIYEAALQAVSIEHALVGNLHPASYHEASDSKLFPIWKEAVKRSLSEPERSVFLSRTAGRQRSYFKTDSPFAYERFAKQLLASGRKHRSVRVH